MGNPRDYALPGNQDPAMPWPSSLVLLSAIAAVTTRLRLAACAVIAPLRHPLLLARELGTLDLLSEGRLVVQPTVSWHRDEYAALGVPFGSRGALLDEHCGLGRDCGGTLRHRSPESTTPTTTSTSSRRPGVRTVHGCGSAASPSTLACSAGSSATRTASIRWGSPPTPTCCSCETGSRQRGATSASSSSSAACAPVFPDDDSAAPLDPAIASIPAQQERGFTTFCIKPSQFVDELAQYPDWCREVVERVSAL